jgi:hypothetical protein
MKEVIKLLKHLYFDKPRYLKRAAIRYEGLDNLQKDIISEVNSKGYYILEDYFDSEVIANMKLVALEREKSLIDSDAHLSFPDFGVERYLKFDDFEEYSGFFSQYFDHIGKNYLGGLGVRYQSMFERKGAPSKKSSADIPHFDDWKKRFKIFLYLNDVTDANCPFVVYENSLTEYVGRKYKEIEYVLGGKLSAYGHLCENEDNALLSNEKVRKVKITGKAGTVIFVDTRFVHKGTASLDGSQRYLLGSYYDIR